MTAWCLKYVPSPATGLGILSEIWVVKPEAFKVSSNLIVLSSTTASFKILVIWSDPDKLAGKSWTIGVLQEDFLGFLGHPASEIDLTLYSTFSPFLIGMSIWFTLTSSPSAILGWTQTYFPNEES